ncbi:MAG: hypothetical protein HQ507_12545 [Candidatus Marinimicrobia bacterium]|nr:hypothetical protein [Candidatus Neomarinimicrobiota bacterium]
MALKRSGRVLVVTVLMLLVFSLLVIWHNRPPHTIIPEQVQVTLDNLILEYPGLGMFVSRLTLGKDHFAFYSLGIRGRQPWPVDLKRACYSDPLAAYGQFGPLKDSYSGHIEVIRYRSLEDFILTLGKAESDQPGFVAGLDLKAHRPLPEDPLGISIGIIVALCLGITGLFLVRKTAK